jgi:hypothetical protein
MATAPAPDIVERMTGYIKHNGTKSPGDLHALVQAGQDQMLAQLDGVSPAQATFKPAPDVWSMLELMHHVVSAKGGVARICERLAKGESIPGQGREGDEQDGVVRGDGFGSIAVARDAMEAAHRDLLAFIDQRLAGANAATRFNHFVFGDLNCAEWAAFQRVHDGDHANQIEQIKSAPGYPA